MVRGDLKTMGSRFARVPKITVMKTMVIGVLIAAVALTLGHSIDKLNHRIKELEKSAAIERAVWERIQCKQPFRNSGKAMAMAIAVVAALEKFIVEPKDLIGI